MLSYTIQMRYFMLLCFMTSSMSLAMTQEESSSSNALFTEKWSVGLGVGVEYALAGMNIKYHLNPKYSIIAAASPAVIFGAGFEYRHALKKTSKFLPTAYFMVGNTPKLKLYNVPGGGRGTEYTFLMTTVGAGTKYLLSEKRIYLTGHITYTLFVNRKSAVEEFDETWGTDYSSDLNTRGVFFSLGINYIISSRN